MTATHISRRTVSGILLFTYWAVLFVATHLPVRGLRLPSTHSDKFVHAAAFAVLALLCCCFALRDQSLNWRRPLLVLLLVAGYAAVDEMLQYPIRSRSPELADWAADVLGTVLGIATYTALNKVRRTKDE
jgi:VanZ family protein